MPYTNDYACTVDGCERKRRTKLHCPTHNARFKKYGDPLGKAKWDYRFEHHSCTIDGCDKKHAAKGMCQMHYRRNRLYGDPLIIKGNPRGQKVAVTNTGYINIYEPEHPNAAGNGFVLEHRKVMADHLGRALLQSENVHHVNGDRTDNRLDNLELWSKAQPQGQRVEDKVKYAIEILTQYAPEVLRNS
jgi:hypothetical protein